MTRWTAKDIQRLQGNKNRGKEPVKKHKYSATRTQVNGIWFDSKKEAECYLKLLLLQNAGYLKDLRLQVAYELNPGGTFSYVYRADFVYTLCETGETVVADCKGFLTKDYKKKRALMLRVHGIAVQEI